MSEDWRDRVSQPKYRLKAEKDVFVTMRDGVRIGVDVYRPECGEKVPALLGISPYSKDVQSLPIFEYPTDRDLGNGGVEAGDTGYFVARGYAHVIAESRGTGVSEGEYGVFGEREQLDGYDLIEWIASQPWCNGKVGMLGMSIGWLKASHREIDAGKSKPWKPFHPHTKVTPIESGRVGEYAIEICDTCWVFKAGHRLELVVKAQDAPWEGTSYIYRLSNHLSPARETRYTLHHTPEYPSHLLLPVIQATDEIALRA